MKHSHNLPLYGEIGLKVCKKNTKHECFSSAGTSRAMILYIIFYLNIKLEHTCKVVEIGR